LNGTPETERQKLVSEYEKAVEAYTAAVHALAAVKNILEFDQTWKSLNALRAKSEDLRKR
jgi:hypothetical protein